MKKTIWIVIAVIVVIGIIICVSRNTRSVPITTAPAQMSQGKAIADLVSKTYKEAAVISEQTDQAMELNSDFTNEMKITGVSVGSNQTFASSTTDFKGMLADIKAVNPDAIFIATQTSANLVAITKQARDLGITAQFFTSLPSDSLILGAGSAVEGMIVTNKASDGSIFFQKIIGGKAVNL